MTFAGREHRQASRRFRRLRHWRRHTRTRDVVWTVATLVFVVLVATVVVVYLA